MSQRARLRGAAAQLHVAAVAADSIAARREAARDGAGQGGSTVINPELPGSRATGPTQARTFPARAAQVPHARRFLAPALNGSMAADDALVCLSEIVTNSIQHSLSARPGGTFAVRIIRRARSLRVEVQDQGGPWRPHVSPGVEHGRGLRIVSQLARAWGRNGDSRTGWIVWFEMDLP